MHTVDGAPTIDGANTIDGVNTVDRAHTMPAKNTSPAPHSANENTPPAPHPANEHITAHNISIGFPHTTEAGWRMGVAAKEKYRPTASAPLRVEMWWPFDRPDPSECDIDRLVDFLNSNNLQIIAMNLWAGDMASGERGVLHREPLPPSHIDAVTRIHELTGVSKFNLLLGSRGEDADPWETQVKRFCEAAVAVYRATGGMVLIENMSGIDDYPIKRIKDALELKGECTDYLYEYCAEKSDDSVIDEDGSEDCANGVGILIDVYHFLTNWEAGIECYPSDEWDNDEWDDDEWDEHEGDENERDENEVPLGACTFAVGYHEICIQLEYVIGCMLATEGFAHVQVATWPDRGALIFEEHESFEQLLPPSGQPSGDRNCEERPSNDLSDGQTLTNRIHRENRFRTDQITRIIWGLRDWAWHHKSLEGLEVVGEWLPGPGEAS